MAKVYDTATDIITFARSSSGTALRRVGYGDELVVDGSGNWIGDFDVAADVSEWTVGLGGSASHTGTAMELTVGASTLCKIEKPYTFSSNKLYRLTFEITSSSAGVSRVYNYSADELHNFGPGNTTGTFEHVFAGGSSTRGFDIRIEGTQGSTASIDNISIKEVIFDRATDPLVLFNHPDDTPRIEYGSDGSLKGLLIEELRTNLLTYSEDFTHSSWSEAFTGAPTPTTTVLDPSGGFTAVTLTATSANGQVLRSIGGSAGTGTSYTGSVYIRRRTGSGTVYLFNPNGAGLTAVTVTSQWARYSVTGNGSASTNFVGVRLATSGDEVDIAYAQFEQGSFATSYIPTSGGQVTRSADVASIPVSAFGYNQDAGTIVVEFSKMYDGSGGFHAGFGANNTNYVGIGYGSTQAAFVQPLTGAINVSGASAPSLGEFSTVAAGFDASGATSAVDGQSRNQTATGSAPALSQSDTLYLGTSPFSPVAISSGHIKSIQYYPRRLTDTQLQELTA